MPTQKVVLITAGSAGLGAQVARVFAPDFRVVINYANNVDRANALVAELSSFSSPQPSSSSPSSPHAIAIRADVGLKSEVTRLVSETISTMGRLDIVISNAGWTRMTDFADLEQGTVDEDWDKCFVYNVKTHLWLLHAARQHLEASEGAFVTTASLAGVRPSGSSLPYAVTKAAQIHLAKSLAVICAPKIRVNSVSPGLLLTEWGMKYSESRREMIKDMARLKRVATVEDVAQQIRTLALSRSITGQNVVVDCGIAI